MLRIALFLTLLAAAAAAQEWTPFLEYKADLDKSEPPPWMKEGTRLCWEVASSAYVSATQPRDTPHTSGAGILTGDVVSLIGRQAVIATRVQVYNDSGMGQRALAAVSVEEGFVGPAAQGGKFWVHPDILAKAFRNWPVVKPDDQGAYDNWGATRGPYEWNGRQVMAMQWTLGGGKYLQYERFVYDEKTGILLFQMSAPKKTTADTRQATSVYKFLSVRDRQLPWAMGRPPAWLARIAAYEYSGSIRVEIPGLPPQAMPISATLTRASVGNNFIMWKYATDPNTPGGAAAGAGPLLVAGPTQTGGLWLPPLEIPKLRQGMLVDRDGTLGATVTVSYVGRSNYGRNIVQVTEDASGYTQYCDYERETGILLAVQLRDKILNKTTEVYFTGKQRGQAAPGGG